MDPSITKWPRASTTWQSSTTPGVGRERTGITQDEVILGLKKEATLEGDGSSHSARVAAWAHLGKHLGIFTDNLTLGGTVGLRWEDALRELE